MTNISAAAESARESARAGDGKFGEQEHSAPEVTVSVSAPATPVIDATGPATNVIFAASRGEYVPLSLTDARKSLHIPAGEPDEVVLATVDLLSKDKSQAYPTYREEQPTFADPGDDSYISTADWWAPAGMTWNEYADAWADDSGHGDRFVMASASFDLSTVGYGEDETAAAEAIAADWVADQNQWDNWGDDPVTVDGDNIWIRPHADFTEEDFTPSLVSRKLGWRLEHSDPRDRLRSVKEQGVIIKDADIRAARDIDGKAVAYAAASGRVPSDAEAVAVARTVGKHFTLCDGYLGSRTGLTVPKETPDHALAALNLWLTSRGKDHA